LLLSAQEIPMLPVQRLRALAAAAILSMFAPNAAYSQSSSQDDQQIQSELAAIGNRGAIIARAREQVLAILETENPCTAWFREADADPVGVFRSLHYQIERNKPSFVFRMADGHHGQLFKHPWAASSFEYGGRNSIISLNPNGLFFKSSLPVLELNSGGSPARMVGIRDLTLSSFKGNSDEAQMTALLHELGHITGRIPEDDDSWDGRSSRNTQEVLRYCKNEIRGFAQKSSSRGN
jgi:hypothetical protein